MNPNVAASNTPVTDVASEIRARGAASENDLAILQDVERAIANDEILRRIDLPTLRIQAHDGTVFLRGHVATRPHREQIEAIVGKVRGVRAVSNQVIADDDLELAVAQALGRDPRTRSDFFHVASTHGVVRLSTRVLRAESFEAAEQVASRVSGVRAVVIVNPGSQQEPRVLLPAIGTTIYCQDGQLGTLARVVLNRSSRQVAQLIVAARLQADVGHNLYGDARPIEYELVIPLLYVDRVVPAGIFLGLTIGEAERLPRYDSEKYVEPDSSWQPSVDYRAEDVCFAKVD
jgi:osmotically-inducible protein OsmY